jgi:hypothetical protein
MASPRQAWQPAIPVRRIHSLNQLADRIEDNPDLFKELNC